MIIEKMQNRELLGPTQEGRTDGSGVLPYRFLGTTPDGYARIEILDNDGNPDPTFRHLKLPIEDMIFDTTAMPEESENKSLVSRMWYGFLGLVRSD